MDKRDKRREVLEEYKEQIVALYQNDSINPCQKLFQKAEEKYISETTKAITTLLLEG